jgi:hypothetical protein
LDNLVHFWCSDFRVIELRKRAGVEEVRRHFSAVLALSDEVRRHRAWNLGEPSTHLFQARSRLSTSEPPPKALDEIRVELIKSGRACLLSDTHDDTLILCQIQRLQGLEHTILINGIDLHGHILIVCLSKPAPSLVSSLGASTRTVRPKSGNGRPVVRRLAVPPCSAKHCSISFPGYRPEHDYEYLTINRELRRQHQQLVAEILTNLQVVATVTRDATTDLLTINYEFSASIVLARCTTTPTGRLRWKIRLDTILHPDITIAARMTGNNDAILDYYLFPTNEMTKQHVRLAEDNGLAMDPYRFDNLDLFTSLAARASITEAA